MRRRASGSLKRRFSSSLWNSDETVAMPSANGCAAMSLSTTGTLASWATSWAMPPPMVPAPSTATERTGRASAPGMPVSFLAASVRWKTWIRLFDTPEVASSPKARASASKPAAGPSSKPVRTTWRAARGAG